MCGDQDQRLDGGERKVGGDVPGLVDRPVVVFVGEVVELSLALGGFDVSYAKLVVDHGEDHVHDDEIGCAGFEAWFVIYACKLQSEQSKMSVSNSRLPPTCPRQFFELHRAKSKRK